MATEYPEINPLRQHHHRHHDDPQQYGTFDPTARRSFQHHTIPVIAEDLPLYTARFIHALPCCNIGLGWFLFAIGFVSILPWLVGAIIFACFSHDWRERPGLAACTVAAFVTILVGGSQLL